MRFPVFFGTGSENRTKDRVQGSSRVNLKSQRNGAFSTCRCCAKDTATQAFFRLLVDVTLSKIVLNVSVCRLRTSSGFEVTRKDLFSETRTVDERRSIDRSSERGFDHISTRSGEQIALYGDALALSLGAVVCP